MTTKLNLQQPAAVGGAVVDLAQVGGREGAPFFEGEQSLIELGHRCYNGESSQGEFKIQLVDLANWHEDFPSAHCLVTMVEDSQTPDVWLSRGRVATDEGGRGISRQEGDLEWSIIVDDCNNELRGQAFTQPWVRPAETDVARLVALQAYTLNGASSTAPFFRTTCAVTVNTSHLAPNTNTVTMPAKKYAAGTQPEEVVRDCADTAGKQFGVVIHHSGGSHLCLFYTVNNDHTTYLSAAKISDQLADWLPTSTTVPVFEPHWEQGVGQIIEMQTVLSGMVGVWGASETAAYVDYPGIEENTDYWVETYHDGFSTTVGQSEDRTAGILEGRRNSHVTHRVSVIMNPDQVHLITAGMSIDIKTAVTFNRGDPAGDPNAYERRRIAECRFEPRIDGRYWVHLDLERPPLRVAPGRGQAGPIPPSQSEPAAGATVDYLWDTFPSPTGNDDTGHGIGSGPNFAAAGGAIYAGSLDSACGSGTFTLSNGDYHFRAIYRSSDSAEQKGVELLESGGGDIGQTALTGSSAMEDGFDFTVSGNGPFSYRTYGPSSGHRSLIYLAEVTHGGTTPAFVGTTPPPAPTGQTGTVGTAPTYAPSDHEHAAQSAEVTLITDTSDYYTSDDVDGALQEIGAAVAAGTDPENISAMGFVGEILITDTPSTPLIFADLLQNEAEDDLVYGDPY